MTVGTLVFWDLYLCPTWLFAFDFIIMNNNITKNLRVYMNNLKISFIIKKLKKNY